MSKTRVLELHSAVQTDVIRKREIENDLPIPNSDETISVPLSRTIFNDICERGVLRRCDYISIFWLQERFFFLSPSRAYLYSSVIRARVFFSFQPFFLSLWDCSLISSYSPRILCDHLLLSISDWSRWILTLETRTVVLQSCRASPADTYFDEFSVFRFKQRDHVPAITRASISPFAIPCSTIILMVLHPSLRVNPEASVRMHYSALLSNMRPFSSWVLVVM